MERHPIRSIRLRNLRADGEEGNLVRHDMTAREAIEHVAEGTLAPAHPEQVDALLGVVLAEILDDHLRDARKLR
jgi:hypothetical protein